MNGAVQYTVSLPLAAGDAIARRAAAMNIRPSEYARRLLEAGWRARVLAERGAPPEDRELDRQVRLVFAMADAKPEGIAAATGMPASRVERILAGWRHVAGEIARNSPETTMNAREALASDEPSPGAGPQAEAPLAETGAGTPAGRGGRKKGRTANTVLPAAAAKAGGAWRSWPIETVRKMWSDGATAAAIGRAIGKSAVAVHAFAGANRDICPRRR